LIEINVFPPAISASSRHTEVKPYARRSLAPRPSRTTYRGDHSNASNPAEQARSDRKIVDAAATQVEVVRQHRNTLSRSRDIANRLLDELDATTGHIGEIEAAIAAATAGDESPKRREAMIRAVSLAARASTLANLAHSLDKFHKHDRQAFGIEGKPQDEARSAEAARLLELQARWQAMTPLQKTRALGAYIEERMREVRAVTSAQAQQS
jgi:hypothetical protein